MKVTFVSNYINHHQIPLSNVLYEYLGTDYTFIQGEPMEEERIRMGWNPKEVPEYVRFSYEEPEECARLVLESDIVIWGGLEDETMLQPRLALKKPVFRYSERLYKSGQWKAISPRGLRKKYLDHTRYRKERMYLLCAGAYVASDFHIVRAYPDKMFTWGYFPECRQYDIEKLWQEKEYTPQKKEILWAARFIDWKHPELVIHFAEELRKQRQDFHITMLGNGELFSETENLIREKKLEEYVTLGGSKSPEEVRTAMEKAPIFLMTSDRLEGWGAVMNEAMNSGCAVIANRMTGAAPYLIQPGKNGYYYQRGTVAELISLIEPLLEEKEHCKRIGTEAYRTIAKLWNARVAGERLLRIFEDVVAGREPKSCWESGPCSKAEIIKERY